MKKVLLILAIILFPLMTLAATNSTIDPLYMGVGARPFGMGRAIIATVDDTNSIFLNPAGLAYSHDWGAASMYTSLLSEIGYNSFGLHKASSNEGFGFGYVGANLSGNIWTSARDPITGRVTALDLVAAGYSSNVLLVSYGSLLNKYLPYDWTNKVALGISFKMFNQSLKSTAETFSASGYNADIGIIYKPRDWLNIGVYGQNVMSESMGGVLRWDTGATETIPSVYKLGFSAKVFGKSYAYWMNDTDVFINLDFENNSIPSYPMLTHIGTEWWIYKFLALRAGLDQAGGADELGVSIDNNLTFGLGLWYGDFGFDYAYHQYGSLTENTTHYFSLSYQLDRNPKPAINPIVLINKDYFKVNAPENRTPIYGETVIIAGNILDSEVIRMTANSNEAAVIEITPDNKVFNAKLAGIVVGKAPIEIIAYDKDGKVLKADTLKLARFATFTDVPEGYWARDAINLLATIGILGGYPDGKFKPSAKINRAELTTLLVRSSGFDVSQKKGDQFKDLKSKHWASKFIAVGVEREIVTGYRDNTFKPAKELTRAEAVVMITRFAGIAPVDKITDKPYADVAANHWAAKAIMAAKKEGLLDYIKDKPFEPNKSLTRAEAAEMISKTKFAKEKATALYE